MTVATPAQQLMGGSTEMTGGTDTQAHPFLAKVYFGDITSGDTWYTPRASSFDSSWLGYTFIVINQSSTDDLTLDDYTSSGSLASQLSGGVLGPDKVAHVTLVDNSDEAGEWLIEEFDRA